MLFYLLDPDPGGISLFGSMRIQIQNSAVLSSTKSLLAVPVLNAHNASLATMYCMTSPSQPPWWQAGGPSWRWRRTPGWRWSSRPAPRPAPAPGSSPPPPLHLILNNIDLLINSSSVAEPVRFRSAPVSGSGVFVGGPVSPPLRFYSIFHYSIHFNTWMVTHTSANHGPSCLTSVIIRELVFPTWYSRSSFW